MQAYDSDDLERADFTIEEGNEDESDNDGEGVLAKVLHVVTATAVKSIAGVACLLEE